MPSGWIILIIVALWAAVLIPSLLRQHDESTESKSVDRFMRAMRTLRRDDPLPEGYTVLMPSRPAAAVAPHVFSKADVPVSPAPRPRSRPVASPAGTRGPRQPVSLLVRRRRAFLLLVAATTLTFLIAVAFGGSLWGVHGLVVGMAVVYVVHLRAEARRAALLRRRRRAPARASTERSVATSATAGAQASSDQRVGRAIVFDAHGAQELDAADVPAESAADRVSAARGWQPIPVPVPTYVNAPKAPRRGKQVEVPPSWSDGLPWAEEQAEIDLVALERPEPEIERLLERRRAVND